MSLQHFAAGQPSSHKPRATSHKCAVDLVHGNPFSGPSKLRCSEQDMRPARGWEVRDGSRRVRPTGNEQKGISLEMAHKACVADLRT